MKFFDQGNKSSGRDSARTSMHKAVCDKCGKSCEVPFKPTGDKPVYCSDCFGKSDSRGSGRSSGSSEKQFEMLSDKLDKIIELLSPSTPKKEVKQEKEVKKVATTKAKKPAKKSITKKKAATKKKK